MTQSTAAKMGLAGPDGKGPTPEQAAAVAEARQDARWLALGANKAHGLRQTNEDKRRAVEAALRMRPEWSDSRIAEHVGVHHSTVGDARKRLAESASQPATRTGRDGRTIDTTNIGRRKEEAREAALSSSARRPPAAARGPPACG
jgi:hypothetical protein